MVGNSARLSPCEAITAACCRDNHVFERRTPAELHPLKFRGKLKSPVFFCLILVIRKNR